ncbi:ABC transporter permease [Natrononativus amylolyticus]|uniref:ABC transporter permease n=1 Tax=Natrononativus amylolyticus TaxID=2963434 RepID=UPI0020CC7F99|nr:ABC transporter permease [Natrononativus amylolyticus]
MALGKFLAKRLVQGVFVIWGVVTITFLLRFLTPGDPVSALTPPDAGPEVRQQMAENLGLNDPFYVQYADYITDLLMLDLGTSMRTGRAATTMIFARLPATLELAFAATIVSIVIAIPLGVISARRRHQKADYGATLFSLVGISTPNFWLGIMLIIFVAVAIGPIPTGGRPVSLVDALGALVFELNPRDLGAWTAAIFLPAITLGTYFTALLTRLTRSGMLEELGKTYVEASRAKGLPETLVLYKHVLRNTLIPIITVLGLQLGTLIGGAVITEQVFSWPGLGHFLIQQIAYRDWVLIQGILIVIGVGFVLINIVVDAMYAYLNPRVIVE